jgi:hypothetical protein
MPAQRSGWRYFRKIAVWFREFSLPTGGKRPLGVSAPGLASDNVVTFVHRLLLPPNDRTASTPIYKCLFFRFGSATCRRVKDTDDALKNSPDELLRHFTKRSGHVANQRTSSATLPTNLFRAPLSVSIRIWCRKPTSHQRKFCYYELSVSSWQASQSDS